MTEDTYRFVENGCPIPGSVCPSVGLHVLGSIPGVQIDPISGVVGIGDAEKRIPLSIEAGGMKFHFTKSYEELVKMGLLEEVRR
jgi:hypothetical protein